MVTLKQAFRAMLLKCDMKNKMMMMYQKRHEHHSLEHYAIKGNLKVKIPRFFFSFPIRNNKQPITTHVKLWVASHKSFSTHLKK